MPVFGNVQTFPDASVQRVAPQMAFALGESGTISASPAADVADFVVPVPMNMTLRRLKAATLTAPTVLTTARIRRGTVAAGLITWADLSATFEVSLAANQRVGSADPADVDVSEGEVLGFSIVAGGGSGTNLLVEVIGTPR